MHGLLEFFKEGGPFMLVNVAFVVVALAVVIERLFSIFLRYRMNEKPFVVAVDRYLQAGVMPNLSRLVARGALTRARSVFPGVTPINWATVSTGTSATFFPCACAGKPRCPGCLHCEAHCICTRKPTPGHPPEEG